MNAVLAVETSMIAEDRLGRLETDVAEIKGDLKTINARLNEAIVANAREFGAVRTEAEKLRGDMEKGFGTLRTDMEKGFGTLRTDMEKGFGTLRADMEKGFGVLAASIESAKLWMLVTGVGSVILIALMSFLGRILKIF